MVRQERYGKRNLDFSRFHRTLDADFCYRDLDGIEYCCNCAEPLALIETALDVGQHPDSKDVRVIRKIAVPLLIPAYMIFYKVSQRNFGGVTLEGIQLRIKQVAPNYEEQQYWTQKQYRETIRKLHDNHKCRLEIQSRN